MSTLSAIRNYFFYYFSQSFYFKGFGFFGVERKVNAPGLAI